MSSNVVGGISLTVLSYIYSNAPTVHLVIFDTLLNKCLLNKESQYTLDLIFSTVCGLNCSASSDPTSKIDEFLPPVVFTGFCIS